MENYLSVWGHFNGILTYHIQYEHGGTHNKSVTNKSVITLYYRCGWEVKRTKNMITKKKISFAPSALEINRQGLIRGQRGVMRKQPHLITDQCKLFFLEYANLI